MKLLRVSRILQIGSAVGAVLLLGLALAGLQSLHKQRDALAEVSALQSAVDTFSAASDSLLVLGADEGLWSAYRASADDIRQRLKRLGDTYPDARKAADEIGTIVRELERVGVTGAPERASEDPTRVGPLALPPRSQILLTEVSGHGMALDNVLKRAIQDRRARLETTTLWVVGLFAVAAVLLAISSFSAFRFLHRRLREPVTNLQETVEAIESGDLTARAQVTSRDELGHLAKAFNEMLERLAAQETSLRTSHDQLADTLEVRQALINALPAHIALLDRDGVIVDVNDQWRDYGREGAYSAPDDYGVGRNYLDVCEAATGSYWREAAQVGQGVREVLAGRRDFFTLEYPCHAPDHPRWFRVMINSLTPQAGAGRELGAVVMHVDITERKLAEEELSRLAYEDPLTGLYSRNGFIAQVEHELGDGDYPEAAMLIMLDVARLRDINESFGVSVGDELIRGVGQRLESMSRDPEPLVGRSGGDQFLLYLAARDASEAAGLRAHLGHLLDKALELNGGEVQVGARFGYTELGDTGRAVGSLIREAEIALHSLEDGDNTGNWACYTEARREETRHRVELAGELRTALQRNEFKLFFQPKVALDDGRVIGAEALIRWEHPERGLQSPGLFIPIAEQSQLIGPIGDWALDEACRHLRAWRDDGLVVQRLAVNVSLVQFVLGDFADTVRNAVERHGIEPGRLTLEITESVFEHESGELLRQLQEIRALGVQLSLDDFGTGYSSLRYLHRYPFHEIKIDKSFVFAMLTDRYSSEVVNTVLGIARALDASTVAEGIEDAATARALREAGCYEGQGFYYSKPLAEEGFLQLLDRSGQLPPDGAG